MSNPWDDISAATGPDELHIRRSDTGHPLDFFYGKDFKGRYIFLYKGRLSGSRIPTLPNLAGVEITLAGTDDDVIDLQLCLSDPGLADIFRALCCNLMAATCSLDAKNADGIGVIVDRLFRWQELLKAAREVMLSQQRITGLCGELLVLHDIFLKSIPPLDAVAAWRGPYGEEQDFVFGRRMIEVKTQLNSADSKLQIASVNQLDVVSGEIFVCHQLLGPSAAGTKGAFTLNALVDQLLENLKKVSSPAADMLSSTLIECGYLRRGEYDSPHYILAHRRYYKVCEGFPALRAATVPTGVNDIRYSILLDACRPYQVDEDVFTASFFR